MLNIQQTYATALCSHINVIFSRLTKLEVNIQNLTEKSKTEQDDIQIDALDFDRDIDGPDTQWVHHTTAVASVHELLTSPDPDSFNASNTQEIKIGTSLTQDIPLKRIPIGLTISPNKFQTIHLQILLTGQQQAASTEHNTFHEIPQLEEEEEDWENGQFADADTNLINRHNTHPESE